MSIYQPTTSSNPMAEFILKRYEQWRQNRLPLQLKCTKNLEAFRGISTGTWKKGEGEGWRSNTFFNATKQKIISAFALVSDMMLMGGRIPFMLAPSPWDEVNLAGLPEDQATSIRKDIDDMERLIDQQFSDCSADRSFLKNILSAAIFGETYAKKLVIDVVRRGWRLNAPQIPGIENLDRLPPELMAFEPYAESHNAPAWEYVPWWDIFRDLETDKLLEGAGVIHRQLTSPFWLRARKDRAYFLSDSIDTVLANASKQGDSSSVPEKDTESLTPALRNIKFRQNTILYLEFWGRVPKETADKYEEDLLANKTPGMEISEIPTFGKQQDYEEGDDVEVMVCVAGDQVVRYCRTSPEERPFFRSVWEENLDDIGGTGVADNAENMQVVLNGAIRAMEDNKKLTANLIAGVKRRYIEGDIKEVKPGLLFDISEECDDARKAIAQVEFTDVGASLMQLIEMAMQFLDQDTMIPKIQQGIQTDQRVTAFEISQQVEKAGKYIGSVIRNQDEGLIEPIVESFYDYNMSDPTVSKGKGNYIVKALGFNSFQDRIERIGKIKQFMDLIVSNPAFLAEARVRKLMENIAKALDIEPDEVLKSEAEKQAEAEQLAAAASQTTAAAGQTPAKAPEELALTGAKAQEAQARASKASAEAAAVPEKLAIERAKAVTDIQAKQTPDDGRQTPDQKTERQATGPQNVVPASAPAGSTGSPQAG